MAYINSHRSPTVKSELDIFAVPPTQNSVESGSVQCYRPVSALTDASPIEFLVPGNAEEYIDLAHTMLHIIARIVPSVENQNVAPVNNFLHSLFTQVDVFLNQKNVSPPSSYYNYRSYIENLLNYGEDAKHTHLQTALWYKDTAKCLDAKDATNTGFMTRKNLTSNKRLVELYGNLHCDIFNQDKFLINGVDLGIRLCKEKPQFCLMSDVEAKVEIVEANLFIRKVKINPSISIAHARALSVATAKYPITRVEIKTITIPTGVQSKTVENLYLGQLPKRCIIGFLSNNRVNGEFALNPFNFQHFNFNYLALFIDSTQIPSKPFQPDFAHDLYARNYHTLFSDSGIFFSEAGNGISYADYCEGYCLTAFDLTPDLSCREQHWNVIRSGTLRFEVRFAQPLETTVTAVIYSEFDNLIEIGQNRSVSLDYSS